MSEQESLWDGEQQSDALANTTIGLGARGATRPGRAATIGIADEFSSFDQRAVIKVCGVGGGGGNAVSRMIASGLKDVDFITINTDAHILKLSPAGTRLQIGAEMTGGLGAGARPEIGEQAALEDRGRIEDVVRGADMVFVTAGLGGGTGTGACPIVAEVARSLGALTVGIVTLPFHFEGIERMRNAVRGLDALEPHVDTLIVVPNERVAALCQGNISFLNAFSQADEVLHNGVRAISDLITVPGLINLDFADVRTIMQARGRALMGIGVAEGENRAVRAAEEAIVCPLLEQSSIDGAMGVIVNIKGGCDIGMREVQAAVSTVQKAAHPKANIIFGAVVDNEQRPELQVTVIAAGFPQEIKRNYLEPFENQATPSRERVAPTVVEVSSAPPTPSAPQAVAQHEAPRPAAAPVAAAPAAPRTPEPQLLFPEDAPKSAQPDAAQQEVEEDLGIPAFMRRRRRIV